MIKNHLINLRPYSWIDLILLGYLAKFTITKSLDFAFSDIYFIAGLLFLWFFFNFLLEVKHGYSYRGKVELHFPITTLVLAIIISIYQNYHSLIPLLISVFLVLIYLQKNRNVLLGNFSSITRGLIEASYFLFAILLLSSSINQQQAILSVSIFLIYTARALIGDIRDVKHNKEANKKTFPVTFGIKPCKFLVTILLLISIIIQIMNFGSFLISVPLILFIIPLIFYNNGYVLHQSIILTTSFFHITFISFITNQNLIFVNLIYLGILLSLVFYPLLKRKSNPKFVQE